MVPDPTTIAATIRYSPPWLPLAVSLGGYLETRIPPHIWLDDVLLVLSIVLVLIVVLHAVLWFVAWLWFLFRRSPDA